MTEDERLYLQFLQNNIARMNTNSAQAKGWCIAIVAALLALFAETRNELFMWICFIPVILFCILDALYLQQEHKFAKMYNAYIKGNENRPTVYEMPMKNYENGLKEFFKTLRSWSVGFVYATMALMVVVFILVITQKKESSAIQSPPIKSEYNQDDKIPADLEPVFKVAE